MLYVHTLISLSLSLSLVNIFGFFTHTQHRYNLDKWAFVDKVATRPNDKVTITVDEADIILDLWMDGFMAAAPEKKESDSSSSDQKGVMTNSYAAKTFNDILDDASDNAYPLLITGLFLIFLYAFVTTGLTLLSLGGVSLVLLGTLLFRGKIISLSLSFCDSAHFNFGFTHLKHSNLQVLLVELVCL